MAAVTLAVVLALAAEGGRICPKQQKWSRLYELLPNTRRDGYGSIPAAPLILGAWGETSDEQKAGRLREHLEWAEQHGGLEKVHSFFASLPEREWHHVGE
ncbi:MAG: hypothetical protein JWQ07_3083 [Ramlibacter sp.]|nr:hypothetical protein [Ramlibacter sp.]